MAWARRAAAAAVVALALGACGGDAAPAPSTVLPAAPEPARGAPTTAPPAGTVVPLGGGRPEGMVADPVTGLVVVALRDPDRLALLDPAAGAVVGTVPVPGSARRGHRAR